jgi:spermidine synthase
LPGLQNPDSGNLGLKFSGPAFLLGSLAASFQILLLREFSAHFFGNELVLGFVLASWLLWGGLGSFWATGRVVRRERLALLFFAIPFLAALAFAGLRFSRFALGILPGETTGLMPMMAFALAAALFINFPLGTAFVFTVKLEGQLGRVYLWESAGAASSGLLTSLVLIPYLSNWEALAVLSVLTAPALALIFQKKRLALFLPALFALSISIALLDFPSQKLFWKPFNLVESRDSIYGKLQVVKTAEQITLYDNGLRVYSYPDPASAEEAVHFNLLQIPSAGRVLLIGGGAGGSLQEILKYPRFETDYVELDPEIIRLSERYLPDEENAALRNPRVHVHFLDGRAFLDQTTAVYDAIMLSLPDPATAQINRFYTLEFFRLVRQKLRKSGIFSFRVSSAENYVSPELQEFLSAMSFTLSQVFPHVSVVPGDSNIFLASAGPLRLEPEFYGQALAREKIKTWFVRPDQLLARLHPLKVQLLAEKIRSGPKILNSDLHPVSYFLSSVLWSKQFKSFDSKILVRLGKLPACLLLDIPLAFLLALLALALLRPKNISLSALPIAILGLTTMAAEIMILLWFQSVYGYIYRQISLLLTAFMAGLAFGALRGIRRKTSGRLQLIGIQFGVLVAVFAVKLLLPAHPPEVVPFAVLLFLGFLGGDFFILANVLFLKEKDLAGVGYGWDLVGSFAAASILSSILVPLAGLALCVHYLFLLNSFALVFLVFNRKPRFR